MKKICLILILFGPVVPVFTASGADDLHADLIGRIEEAYASPGNRALIKPAADELIAGGPGSALAIIAALERGDLAPDTQSTLCYLLGVIDSPGLSGDIIPLLARKDLATSARIRLSRLLQRWDPDGALPEMLRIIVDREEDRNLRIVNIRILGERREPSVLTALTGIAGDEQSGPYVRYKAVQMLENIPDRAAEETLIELIQELRPGNDFLVQRAIIGLGNKQSVPAVDPLIRIAEAGGCSPIVRKRAVLALGRIGAEKAVPLLERLSRDENRIVRENSRAALDEITGGKSAPEAFPEAMEPASAPNKLSNGPEKRTE